MNKAVHKLVPFSFSTAILFSFFGNICVYCPGGPDSDFEYSSQSYTGYEPTSMRAIRARYNPYLQTKSRIAQLTQLGHSVDKVSIIFGVNWKLNY